MAVNHNDWGYRFLLKCLPDQKRDFTSFCISLITSQLNICFSLCTGHLCWLFCWLPVIGETNRIVCCASLPITLLGRFSASTSQGFQVLVTLVCNSSWHTRYLSSCLGKATLMSTRAPLSYIQVGIPDALPKSQWKRRMAVCHSGMMRDWTLCTSSCYWPSELWGNYDPQLLFWPQHPISSHLRTA